MIRNIETDHGQIESAEWIRLAFGPHHFVEIAPEGDRLMFRLGQTHHGVQLDASRVDGDLEQAIGKLRNLSREITGYEASI